MIGLGVQELIIVLIIIVVLFGATRLPQLGKGIGLALRNFKKATSELEETDQGTKKSPVANPEVKEDETNYPDEPH